LKKVIALWGAARSGKSSTLKIVYMKLSKMAEGVIPGYTEEGTDVRDIFLINGKKVGIESQGDPGSRLGKSLSIFKKEGCELIICATRSKGHTKELVNKLKPLYSPSWRGQSSLSLKENRDVSNQALASLILKEAKVYIYDKGTKYLQRGLPLKCAGR
jgi:hypothetical protein